jgi:hypothetical protein
MLIHFRIALLRRCLQGMVIIDEILYTLCPTARGTEGSGHGDGYAHSLWLLGLMFASQRMSQGNMADC